MHDDPASRTGLSWARTTLGVLAVAGLIARGVLINGLDHALLAATALLPVAFIAVAVYRRRLLSRAAPAGSGRPTTIAAMVLVLLVASSAAASVLLNR